MNAFFPDLLITYLFEFRQAFSHPSFVYFQGVIFALLISGGRKCVTQLASVCFFVDKSLSGWERFFAESQWNLPLVSAKLIDLCLDQLGERALYAQRYLVALDTTFAQKALGKMTGVQRWRKGVEEKTNDKPVTPHVSQSVVGHHWAIAGLLCLLSQKWQCFPLLTRLISGKQRPSHFVVDPKGETCPMDFWQATIATVTEVAAKFVKAPVCFVADAYFSKAPFLNPLIEKGIGLVTRLRHDAVGWDDPDPYQRRGRPAIRGRKWKLAQLLEELPHQEVSVRLYGKTVKATCVVRDLWLRDITQKVRVVVVSALRRPILVVSTQLSLTAGEIIEIYGARFALELTIRDLKQHFGFGDYQSTTTLAFLRWSRLCCCALSIGRLLLLNPDALAGLEGESPDAVSESRWSLRKLRRSLKGFVISRLLLCQSAPEADWHKSEAELSAAIVRIAV